jgi:hypothetical protein
MASSPPKLLRKRPCSMCGKWFHPDARVGDRQRVCSLPACQAKRKRKQEAAWRERNANYHTARRWQEARDESPPAVVKTPPPLEQVPWDLVKTQFGPQQAVILALLVRLLLRHAQTQRQSHPCEIHGDPGRHAGGGPQTQTENGP